MHIENPIAWAIECCMWLPFVYATKLVTAHHEFVEDMLHLIPREDT